jgi:hypothetical protein
MKNLSNEGIQELNPEELRYVRGGSEFSLSFFRTIGLVVGGLQAIGESWMDYQARMAEKGYHPVH